MVAKARVSTGTSGIFSGIDPLRRLEEEREAKLADGTLVNEGSWLDLMRNPSISFRQPKQEESTEVIDTLARGEGMEPISIEEGSGPLQGANVVELINMANQATQEQRMLEDRPTISENYEQLQEGGPSPFLDDSSKEAVTSFTRPSDTFQPINSEEFMTRMDSVVAFVNDGKNLAKQSSTVTGLSYPSEVTVNPRIKGVKTIPVKEATPEEIGQSIRDSYKQKGTTPGSLRSALHSLDAVKSIDLGHKIKRFSYKATPDGRVLDTKEGNKIEGPDVEVSSIVPNNKFLQISSVFAEDYFAGTVNSDASTATETSKSGKPLPKVSKSQSSEVLGRQIIEEYRKSTNQNTEDDIISAEAVAVGDFAKTIYQITHPNLVKRTEGNNKGVETTYQLTPEGQHKLNNQATSVFRRRLIGGYSARPRRDRIVESMDVNKTRGKRKGQRFSKRSNEAVNYFNNVPVVVDKRRLSLFIQTALPFFKSKPELRNYIETYLFTANKNPQDLWKLDALGLGSSKVADIELSIKQTQDINKSRISLGLPAHPVSTLEKEYDKAVLEVLETLKVLVMESDGIRYFNHARQGYSGRIDVTERYFNYQSSKIVRAVIRSPNRYEVRKGSRAEGNLRQLYAMILTDTDVTTLDDVIEVSNNLPITGKEDTKKVTGSEALPMVREMLLNKHSEKLEGWGDRLKAAYNVSPEGMVSNVDNVTNEILKENADANTVFNRPTFPEILPVQLDPEADADLIQAISSQGMDGLLFIEGLIEYSDYAKWKRSDSDRPFYGKFNGHVDGKTSGAAILTLLLGNLNMSYLVGINRKGIETLTDKGDVRDQMQHILYQNLETNPVDSWSEVAGFNELTGGNTNMATVDLVKAVALEVFKNRELHKHTIMTTPYGKEFASFRGDVKKTIESIYQEKSTKGLNSADDMFMDAYERLDASKNLDQTSNVIHENYVKALNEVLSDFMLEYKSITRSFTKLSQAMNTPVSIKSMTGTDLIVSTKSSGGYKESDAPRAYKIAGRNYSIPFYKTIEDMSATPNNINEFTKENEGYSGGDEFSSAVAMLVHGVDADIIVKTASGNSLKRLKQAVGEDPEGLSNSFFLPIFDAAMVDIGSYDTVVRELNRNFDSALNYNPFDQMRKGLEKSFNNYIKSLNETKPDINTAQDAAVDMTSERPDTDLLSDREKAFIVDLVSFNSKLQEKGIDEELKERSIKEEKHRSVLIREMVPAHRSSKFDGLSVLELTHDAEYFTALPLNKTHIKISSKQDHAFEDLKKFLERYNFDVMDGNVNLNYDTSTEVIEPEQLTYDETIARLDVAFLKGFLTRYRNYLFGDKHFSRLHSFANMTEENRKQLRKEIDKNGMPFFTPDGRMRRGSIQYYTR